MALIDPQSVTVNAVPISLPRTEIDKTASGYTSADGTVKLTVSHQFGRRNRSIIRIDTTKISPDPLTDVKQKLSSSVYLLIDRPIAGFPAAELKDTVDALATWSTENAGENLLKVLGGQS